MSLVKAAAILASIATVAVGYTEARKPGTIPEFLMGFICALQVVVFMLIIEAN